MTQSSYATDTDGANVYVSMQQRPGAVSMFEVYEASDHDAVAAPWVHLTPREAIELGAQLIEFACMLLPEGGEDDGAIG